MDFEQPAPAVGTFSPDIGDPKVSVVDLWKIALSKGANKDAVAMIRYDGSAYDFSIKGSNVSFMCDASGKIKP